MKFSPIKSKHKGNRKINVQNFWNEKVPDKFLLSGSQALIIL
jgi:hypothetical protein